MTERSAGKEEEGVFLFLTSNISAKTIPYLLSAFEFVVHFWL